VLAHGYGDSPRTQQPNEISGTVELATFVVQLVNLGAGQLVPAPVQGGVAVQVSAWAAPTGVG
jgi:hypothetical protein